MNIGIIDADLLDNGTNFPNLALMKISSYYKNKGHNVSLINSYNDLDYDLIYLSKVFDYTKIPIDLNKFPHIIYGGTGFFYDKAMDLPYKIEHSMPDYDLYNKEGEYYNNYSMGFTTRGCFRKCSFCVNKKYDKVLLHSPVEEFLDHKKKYICLLDDNILAFPGWKDILISLMNTNKPFQFKQGLDIRLLTEEKSKVLSEAKYKGDYIFAFDDIKDKEIIEQNLKLWRKYCNKSTKLYILCAYNRQDVYDIITVFERIKILFKYRCLPYIMRYKNYKLSKWKGIYITLARWCNQPHLVKKLSFRQFCEKCGGSALRYMREFQKEHNDIAEKYFDITFSA